jgi:hypothetical protein
MQVECVVTAVRNMILKYLLHKYITVSYKWTDASKQQRVL